MKRALFIMAKEPIPGQVKTRLCPPLTPELAAEFYRCFLLDVFDIVQKLKKAKELKPLDIFLAYYPGEAKKNFRALAPAAFKLFTQEGADLSARLINGFSRLFGQGYARVAVLGSDSPTLSPQELIAGFLALEEKKENFTLALKPSQDGGYCFLAMKQFHPEVFRDIDWSTEHVGEQTRARAKAGGISCFILPSWYDIDTVRDLRFLKELLILEKIFDRSWPVGQHTLQFFKTHLQEYVDKYEV